MFTTVINKQTNQPERIDIENVYDMISSDKYRIEPDQPMLMLNPEKKLITIKASDFDGLYNSGYTPVLKKDVDHYFTVKDIEGSSLESGKAFVEGALDMGTFGSANYLLKKIGAVDPEREKIRAETHDIARGVGGATGLIGSLLLPTGWAGLGAKGLRAATFAPRALAAGTRMLEKSLTKSLGSELLAKTAAYGVEGGIYGLQGITSDAQLGNSDLVAQKVLFDKGLSNFTFGALIGGGIPIAGKVFSKIGRLAKIPDSKKLIDKIYNVWGKHSRNRSDILRKWMNVHNPKIREKYSDAHYFSSNPEEIAEQYLNGVRDNKKMGYGLNDIYDYTKNDLDYKIYDPKRPNLITDSIKAETGKNPELISQANATINNYMGFDGKIENMLKSMIDGNVEAIDLGKKVVKLKGVKKVQSIRSALLYEYKDAQGEVDDLINELLKFRDSTANIDKKTFKNWLKTNKPTKVEDVLFPELTQAQKKTIPAVASIKNKYISPAIFEVPSEDKFWSQPMIQDLAKISVNSDDFLNKLMKLKKFQQSVWKIKESKGIINKLGEIKYDKSKFYDKMSSLYSDLNDELFKNPSIVGEEAADQIISHAAIRQEWEAELGNLERNFGKAIEAYDEDIGKNIWKYKLDKDKVIDSVRKAGLGQSRTEFDIIDNFINQSHKYVEKLKQINKGKLVTELKGKPIDFFKIKGMADDAGELSKLFREPVFSQKDIGTLLPPFLIGSALGTLTGLPFGWGTGALLVLLMKAMKHPSIIISSLQDIGRYTGNISKIIRTTGKTLAKKVEPMTRESFIAPVSAVSALNIKGNDDEKVNQVIDNINDLSQNPQKMYNAIKYMNATLEETAPNVASQLGMNAINAINFLASKTPKLYTDSLFPTKNKRTLSSSEKLQFMNYLSAVNNPKEIIDNIQNGTVSNEELDVLRNVFPSVYQELKDVITEELSTAEEEPDYKAKQILSKIFGADIDSANTNNITLLQNAFKPIESPEQAGGVTARKSIKNTGNTFQSDMQRIEGRTQ